MEIENDSEKQENGIYLNVKGKLKFFLYCVFHDIKLVFGLLNEKWFLMI